MSNSSDVRLRSIPLLSDLFTQPAKFSMELPVNKFTMTMIYFNNRITNKIQSIIFRSRQQFFITTEFENQIDMHFNYRATTIGTSGQVINELPHTMRGGRIRSLA